MAKGSAASAAVAGLDLEYIKNLNPIVLLFAVVGALLLVKFGLNVLGAIWRFFLRPGKNLKKLGGWAVITGATDGIGKAYAFELARKGLNVLLISRTESKLKDTAAEIKAKYPKTEVQILSIDFSNFDGAAQAKVAKAVKGIDVGVLINNVGQSYDFPMYLDELTDEQVHSLVELNITSTLWMTRIVLPGMVAKKKGAIVNLASAASRNPSPLLSLYSGCKSFIELFSQSLDSEYRSKGIHVQVQTPLFVATKLAKIRKASLTVPSPAGYAKAAVRFIGYEDSVSPYWSHAFQLYLMSAMHKSLLHSIVFGMHAGLRKRGLKKKAEKSS